VVSSVKGFRHAGIEAGAIDRVTVAVELHRSSGRYGLATQCIGAGMGISTLIERLD
jgi:acetyl-CoA acetyltransferase